METRRILSTKKLLPNQRNYLLNAGLAVVEADFLGISYKPFTTGTVKDNLIFTSQNAFRSFLLNEKSGNLKDRKVFCVGPKTREMIESHGFTVAAFADNAVQLSAIITGSRRGESFTFFSGNLRFDTLPVAMEDAGVTFNEIEVYETTLTPHRISATPDGILFYSPSGVESYLKQNSINCAACFCIGTTTAAALEGLADTVIVANKPTVENVIIQCRDYFKDKVSF